MSNNVRSASSRDEKDAQIEELERRISLARDNDDTKSEIEAHLLLGTVCHEKSDLKKAHYHRLRASTLADALGAKCSAELQMQIEGDLGRSYIAARDWDRAKTYTEAAVRTAISIRDDRSRDIWQMNLGVTHAAIGRVDEAIRLGQRVLRSAESRDDKYVLGLQHLNLGHYLLTQLRVNEALRHMRCALGIANLTLDSKLRTRARILLGELHRIAAAIGGRGDYSELAVQDLLSAVASAQASGDSLAAAEGLARLGEALEAGHGLSEALPAYQRVSALLDRVRTCLGYEDFQLTFFASWEAWYHKLVSSLLKMQNINDAFFVAEQFRSRVFLAQLGQQRPAFTTSDLSADTELRGILNQYGHAAMQQAFFGNNAAKERGLGVGLPVRRGREGPEDHDSVLLARQKFLEHYESKRLHMPQWTSSELECVVDLEQARALLSDDDALVTYLVSEENIAVIAVTRSQCHFQHLPYSAKRVTKDINRLFDELEAMQDQVGVLDLDRCYELDGRTPRWPTPIVQSLERVHKRLEALYSVLIAPILPAIYRMSSWVIVPSGPLFRIPWCALRDSSGYLVERRSVCLLPSVSSAAFLNAREDSGATETLLFADPDLEDPVLMLPGSVDEVTASHQVVGHGPPPFIGATASKTALLSHIPNAKLIHVACHHVFDANVPLLSFLKLAGNSGADFLYSFEVLALKISAELVSLSACESGRSRVATGDEQYGMVRSFLSAGACSVMSTLWCIEDQSAAIFFWEFYRNAINQPLTHAVAMAQRHMLRHPLYRLPIFWAAYFLSGRWNRPLSSACALT